MKIKEDHRHDGSQLDDHEEHFDKSGRGVQFDELIDQNHMAGAANGQPFGNSLHDSQDDCLHYFYKKHVFNLQLLFVTPLTLPYLTAITNRFMAIPTFIVVNILWLNPFIAVRVRMINPESQPSPSNIIHGLASLMPARFIENFLNDCLHYHYVRVPGQDYVNIKPRPTQTAPSNSSNRPKAA